MSFNSHFLKVHQIQNKERGQGLQGHTYRNKTLFLWLLPPLHFPPPFIPPTPLSLLWGHSGLLNSYQCFQKVFIHVSQKLASMAQIIPLCWLWVVTLTWYLTDTLKISANLKRNYFPGGSLVSFRNRPLVSKSHLSSRYTQTCLNFLWVHSSASP